MSKSYQFVYIVTKQIDDGETHIAQNLRINRFQE